MTIFWYMLTVCRMDSNIFDIQRGQVIVDLHPRTKIKSRRMPSLRSVLHSKNKHSRPLPHQYHQHLLMQHGQIHANNRRPCLVLRLLNHHNHIPATHMLLVSLQVLAPSIHIHHPHLLFMFKAIPQPGQNPFNLQGE